MRSIISDLLKYKVINRKKLQIDDLCVNINEN